MNGCINFFWKDICKQLVTVGTSVEGLKDKVKGRLFSLFTFGSLGYIYMLVCVCVYPHITTNENIINY